MPSGIERKKVLPATSIALSVILVILIICGLSVFFVELKFDGVCQVLLGSDEAVADPRPPSADYAVSCGGVVVDSSGRVMHEPAQCREAFGWDSDCCAEPGAGSCADGYVWSQGTAGCGRGLTAYDGVPLVGTCCTPAGWEPPRHRRLDALSQLRNASAGAHLVTEASLQDFIDLDCDGVDKVGSGFSGDAVGACKTLVGWSQAAMAFEIITLIVYATLIGFSVFVLTREEPTATNNWVLISIVGVASALATVMGICICLVWRSYVGFWAETYDHWGCLSASFGAGLWCPAAGMFAAWAHLCACAAARGGACCGSAGAAPAASAGGQPAFIAPRAKPAPAMREPLLSAPFGGDPRARTDRIFRAGAADAAPPPRAGDGPPVAP